MRIAFYQTAPLWGDKKANLEKVAEALGRVKTDLLLLPELFSTGYLISLSEEGRQLAEEIPGGETVGRMKELVRNTGTALAGGLLERAGDKFFNSAVLILPPAEGSDEVSLGHYRKVHLFDEEKYWITPGDLGFPLFDFRGVRLGMLVCFDWVFPEAARILALKGADILLHPSNLVLPYCQEAMRTRALENGVFAVTANRVGTEEKGGGDQRLTFTGMSQAAGPRGEVICRAGSEEEELRVFEIDPGAAREKFVTGTNHLLGDRRVECYGELVDPGLVPEVKPRTEE